MDLIVDLLNYSENLPFLMTFRLFSRLSCLFESLNVFKSHKNVFRIGQL